MHQETWQPRVLDADLPVLDLPSEPCAHDDETVATIAEASAGWGMFRMRTPDYLADRLLDCAKAARQFFTLDRASKLISHQPSDTLGYAVRGKEAYGQGDEGCDHMKEVFDIGPPDARPNANVYPPHPQEFRRAADRLYQAFEATERRLLSGFSRALATIAKRDVATDFLDTAKGSHRGLLRLNCYPAKSVRPPPQVFRDGAHTDWSMLTILFADGDGLEVFQDGEWRNVRNRPGELVVSVGDLLHRISNGRFASARHRVRADGETAKPRLSIVYFGAEHIDPCDTNIVTPLSAPGDRRHFEPFTIRDFVSTQSAVIGR